MIQRPTRGEVLAGLLYLVAVLGLTWLALAEPYTNAYWIRFLILSPSSIAAFVFDSFVLVLLFGPSPTTWVADLYITTVAIAAVAMQLSIGSSPREWCMTTTTATSI